MSDICRLSPSPDRCPICNSPDIERSRRKDGQLVIVCDNCGAHMHLAEEIGGVKCD